MPPESWNGTILRRSSLCRLMAACASLALAAFGAASARGAGEQAMEKPLRVLKSGDALSIRSSFSPDKDLLVRVGRGTNRQINFTDTLLVNASTPMSWKEMGQGEVIHNCGDDSTPWNINGGYIGANHGCSRGRQLACAAHGRTVADLGSEWVDEAGHKFYLIRIVNADTLWFLGENTAQGESWDFNKTYAGKTLTSKARGAVLTFTKTEAVQITPSCRIRKQEYLADGKTPLEDGKAVSCAWLDIVEEYDIINPGSLLDDLINHPGVERSFVGDELAGVIRNQITYRFFPNGATVVYTRSKALQNFSLGYMGFIQSARLAKGSYRTQEYYIPKTVPFVKERVPYDFRGIQDFSSPFAAPLQFTAEEKSIENPGNLPDRFIQFLGRREEDKSVREVGYAIGYSLICGITVPSVRAKNVASALRLFSTRKSYPAAIDEKMGSIATGSEFYCVAYRQYFNPRLAGNATCLYWHPEEKDLVVYADYHQSVDHDPLALPAEFAGKKITCIEKTPSLTIHGETVPAEGLRVSVTGGYGYVVFKLD